MVLFVICVARSRSTACAAGLRHRQAARRPPLAAPFAAATLVAGQACWSSPARPGRS